jgi:crotonobetainyl-CoA:carnitine CoA-transferase CaiB-like acyl-CoA transferase
MFDLLAGVRVLEFGILLNGDHLGMLLGDLGAEVIKVEEPVKGDYIRDMLGIIVPHHSPAHLQVNKNKKSVAIDVNTEAGKHAFFELLKTVDIFADGLRGGACEAMGIGYDAQRAVKPDIIYMANTGFGMTGPYSRLGAHGYSMLAVAGGLPAQKDADGFVDRCESTDLFGGIKGGPGAPFAVMAGLGALLRRGRTGQGAYIDVAASDANLASSWLAAVTNLNYPKITDLTGMAPRGEPNEGWPAGSILYSLFEAGDGRFMMFCAIEPKFWYNFCDAVGRADLRDTIRTDIPVDYGIDRPWLLALERNIPMSVANSLDQVPEDPHNRARGILLEGHHPRVGPFTYVRYPAIIDGRHSEVVIPAPALGEHTEEVLGGIGLSADEIAAARAPAPRKPKP